MEGELGLAIKSDGQPECAIRISCKCGVEFKIPFHDGWQINMLGVWQFQCPCGKITNVPYSNLWRDEDGKCPV